MKTKDVIFAVIAVGILMVAGYLGYTQLVPKTSSTAGVTVEKIGKIPDSLDSEGRARIDDTKLVIDYNSAEDYSGLGNKAPFGP